MSKPVSDSRSETGAEREVVAYEPPAIAWQESYEPVGFGASCAKEDFNPGCQPGPILD